MHTRTTIAMVAALLAAPVLITSLLTVTAPLAAAPAPVGRLDDPASVAPRLPGIVIARAQKRSKSPAAKAKPTAQPAVSAKLPPRIPFTAAEDAAAVIPDMPDARFWADSQTDFQNALPSQPGPWLVLSSGGEDGAFGGGLLAGLDAAGKRPDYAVVTGVSTGALMAPFVFAGPQYDERLHHNYTQVTAADIFEAGGSSGESFADSWPLRDLIAKEVTPALLADIAAQYRRGRRLFIITTDLDAERSVVWNMGAIAAHAAGDGADAALKLFRRVLLASASVPGAFPPVMIDVEADGKHFQEMHADGGIGGQFFVAPAALMASTSSYRLPATQLYIVVNTNLKPDFAVVERFAPSILAQSVGMAVKVDTRLMLDRTYVVAKRSAVPFNVATIPANFNAPSKGPFDPKYMGALYQVGVEQGQSATPFSNAPPPYPTAPTQPSSAIEKTGANR